MPILGTEGAATLGIRGSDGPGLKGPLPPFRPRLFPHQKQPFLCIYSAFWLGLKKKIWPCHVAGRILAPWPGIEPRPWQRKHQILTTGLPGNSQALTLI